MEQPRKLKIISAEPNTFRAELVSGWRLIRKLAVIRAIERDEMQALRLIAWEIEFANHIEEYGRY